MLTSPAIEAKALGAMQAPLVHSLIGASAFTSTKVGAWMTPNLSKACGSISHSTCDFRIGRLAVLLLRALDFLLSGLTILCQRVGTQRDSTNGDDRSRRHSSFSSGTAGTRSPRLGPGTPCPLPTGWWCGRKVGSTSH